MTDFQFILLLWGGFAAVLFFGLVLKNQPINAGTVFAVALGGLPIAGLAWLALWLTGNRTLVGVGVAGFAFLGFSGYLRRR